MAESNWHVNFITNLAANLKPNLYVELGIYQGETFNNIIPYAKKLIGIDPSDSSRSYINETENVIFICSTSTEAVSNWKYGEIDLLFIDADHNKESVLEDFWNYFPMVKQQGIILLHDTYPASKFYIDPGYCGNAYLVPQELHKSLHILELVTIPIPPGLTICRKRIKQLEWENE